MERYKPEYIGKVISADDPSKLTDFVANKYSAFSTIYNACKDQSEHISTIAVVENNDTDTFSVKVSAGSDVLDYIKEATKDNGSIVMINDVITAKCV